MSNIYDYFINNFKQALKKQKFSQRRIGSELKFPLVNEDGSAASLETVNSLWEYLILRGWEPVIDLLSNKVVGARKAGELNHTVASCETGYCKTEFSLAHVADLFELEKSIGELKKELRPFSEENRVHFLGYGIQPVTPPSKRLLMKRGRTSVWDMFSSNRHIAKEDGNDMHLFTVNAASHLHVSIDIEETVSALNVLNGFVGAQIALTANSNIWKGRLDPHYKCVAEKFWDWWLPDSNRVAMPLRPFRDLRDYVRTITSFKPVFVKRQGKPIVLDRYQTFGEYYLAENAVGKDIEGNIENIVPETSDIDIHNSCYWYNSRISQYYTIENRANDQQPPGDLICIAALTLGLISALGEAGEELASFEWNDLRQARETACTSGLCGQFGDFELSRLAGRMLEVAKLGLFRRGLGEEKFLQPLFERIKERTCPADRAERIFTSGGIKALINESKL
jgi:glutamate--cysteine ligase